MSSEEHSEEKSLLESGDKCNINEPDLMESVKSCVEELNVNKNESLKNFDSCSNKETVDSNLSSECQNNPIDNSATNSDDENSEIELKWDDDETNEIDISNTGIQKNNKKSEVINENVNKLVNTNDISNITCQISSISNENLDITENVNTSNSETDKSLDTSIVCHDHGLKNPDMMIEIPTQELIDPDCSSLNSTTASLLDIGDTKLDIKQPIGTDTEILKASNINNDLEDKLLKDKTTENSCISSDAMDDVMNSASDLQQNINSELKDPIDSPLIISKNTADESNVVPEMTDSLGLLSESFRVSDDDDDEPEEEDDDDLDEVNNLMTGDNSEESNSIHSDTEGKDDDISKQSPDNLIEDIKDVTKSQTPQVVLSEDDNINFGDQVQDVKEVDEMEIEESLELSDDLIEESETRIEEHPELGDDLIDESDTMIEEPPELGDDLIDESDTVIEEPPELGDDLIDDSDTVIEEPPEIGDDIIGESDTGIDEGSIIDIDEKESEIMENINAEPLNIAMEDSDISEVIEQPKLTTNLSPDKSIPKQTTLITNNTQGIEDKLKNISDVVVDKKDKIENVTDRIDDVSSKGDIIIEDSIIDKAHDISSNSDENKVTSITDEADEIKDKADKNKVISITEEADEIKDKADENKVISITDEIYEIKDKANENKVISITDEVDEIKDKADENKVNSIAAEVNEIKDKADDLAVKSIDDKITNKKESTDELEKETSLKEAGTNIVDNKSTVIDESIVKNTKEQDVDIEELSDSDERHDSKQESKPEKDGNNIQVISLVDLENSSSDDESNKESLVKKTKGLADLMKCDDAEDSVMNVNIPQGVEVISSAMTGNSSQIVSKESAIVISGVPKPAVKKRQTRLNTSEISIKPASSALPLVIPETVMGHKVVKHEVGLDLFNLDSDDEEEVKDPEIVPIKKDASESTTEEPPDELMEMKTSLIPVQRCANSQCTTTDPKTEYIETDASILGYYDTTAHKNSAVCMPCAEVVYARNRALIDGIMNLTPLLELGQEKPQQDVVELSDSDSEDEIEDDNKAVALGEETASLLENQLADMMNGAWRKYSLDQRLKDTEIELQAELDRLDKEGKEINTILSECQSATDKLRNDLYGTFERSRKELPAIMIDDKNQIVFEKNYTPTLKQAGTQLRQSKRRLSTANEVPAKKAIPLGFTGDDMKDIDMKDTQNSSSQVKQEEEHIDKDISVVGLSNELAPSNLPPVGELCRPPLLAGMSIMAVKCAHGVWRMARIVEVNVSAPNASLQQQPFTQCRVKFEHKIKNPCKVLAANSLAYAEASTVRLSLGARVAALYREPDKKATFYSGVVAEVPNPVNKYRYLVFFDDGYAQYVSHSDTRLVCQYSHHVWEEVQPFSKEFIRQYLVAYPERPMVRLHAGQSLKTEWKGEWWVSQVIEVDASLAHVHFDKDNRSEWIYRGSTRLAPLYLELQAAVRQRNRPMPRGSNRNNQINMPYVEYIRADKLPSPEKESVTQTSQQLKEEIRRQRAVAKKSTVTLSQPPMPIQNVADQVTSRVVYYTPKNAVRPYKMRPHNCSVKCRRTDVLALKDLRTYNPLAKPLLCGWERQIVRFKGHKDVMYRAPCGRRIRNMPELHHYLSLTQSNMPVDLFDFAFTTHCLAEFVLNKCIVSKKDLSHGKENVPVPCVNYYDDSLPDFCTYNTERTPTAGVPLNLDPDFLCGCDCTDDCKDKTKCACWKLTLEGARTIGLGSDVGYKYKRLQEPLPSGIYECNSRCKCKSTCLNRVAQHPLQLKLQVFKTLNRGWGIRALNDVPNGSFLCVYAGNLLTDATANLDGLNEGDEYLAELDYIEVVEQMKEGYEDDIPDADKRLDQKESSSGSEADEASDEDHGKYETQDDDFKPDARKLGDDVTGLAEYNKRLRRRSRMKPEKDEKEDEEEKKKEEENKEKDAADKKTKADEDCITISDDEEVREPSRFMAEMASDKLISKYRSVRSHFGKDEACYIMDAKVQGNIGRYLNHSCTPNVFVQNVFVDTHDPRFPWVAFFALCHVKAGTELTWNYNYDVGSVPGKTLYCYCGAPNCRGRLL